MTQAKSAAALFDDIGKAYQVAFDHVPGQLRSLDWVISNLKPGSKVLDIGSGTGRPACQLLVQAGFNVTGIDISPVMVRIASEQVPQARFVQEDWRNWKPDEDFDAIVVYFSIIADVTQQDIRDFFGLVYKWLAPGGYFVFATVPVAGENATIKFLGRSVVVSGLDVQGNLKAIESAGFTIEKHECDSFKPKGEESGLCDDPAAEEEPHLFVYARKK